MGYWVSFPKGRNKWYVTLRNYENGKPVDARICQDELLAHGFTPGMTLEEAKARAKQLNAQDKIRQAENRKKHAIQRRQKNAEIEQGAYLPETFVKEFEETVLKKRFYFGANAESKYKKAQSRWTYAKRMIVHVGKDPGEWFDEPRDFYSYFIENKTSVDHATKVLRVLNMWGMYISRKQGKAFLPVPAPRGYEREELADAYLESEKSKKNSAPLTATLLEQQRDKFRNEQANWLSVSLWFGLRPSEVDSLRESCRVETANDGVTQVLCVYQGKLKGVAKDKRYKRIPVITPEQTQALEVIKSGAFKRPLVKTVKKYLGEQYTLYAGRKGFTDLMLSINQDLADISQWLGHTSIDRTWRDYKDKQLVRFKPVKRDAA